jgi:plasmid maintenance system antidote protein VapI
MGPRNIYHYLNYKEFLKTHFRRKRGELQLGAKALSVHMSKLTRVIRDDEHLTPEQALKMSRFLKLESEETEYFLNLVSLGRSSDSNFNQYMKWKLAQQRGARLAPHPLIPMKRPLSPSEETLYHSSFLFGAVWLSSMINGENSLGQIAERLDQPTETISQIASFLCEVGLCTRHEDELQPGARLMEISSSSPILKQFLSTWRVQGIQKLGSRNEKDLFYSEPMAIGQQAYENILKILKTAMTDARSALKKERSEVLACLNIDFFQVNAPSIKK